ncbi:MAG: TlyA family RNA methyltransferase [Puniceicoccaceae bacterium]
MSGKRKRLDQLLLERGLCESRSQARALVLAGKVRRGTEILDKPGREIPADADLAVERPPRFVSRAGEKLAGFLDRCGIDPAGKRVLDVGASTGGFTDCLLQRGAVHSTCVDVGRGQLHHRLRTDPRVSNHERLHAARLPEADLPHPDYDWVVMDLSFISLRKILPAVWPRVRAGGLLICLVKPQFEATRQEADAGRGIIRDPAVRGRVLREVIEFTTSQLPDAVFLRSEESTLAGTDGNREFLAAFGRSAPGEPAGVAGESGPEGSPPEL